MKNSDEPRKGLNDNLRLLQEQVADHLDAINENTSEIANTFEYVVHLEAKLDKLFERLDQLQLLVESHLGIKAEASVELQVLPLTKREQEVFLILYTHEDEANLVEDIARLAGISVDMIREIVTSMIAKGVPIVQRAISGRIALSLDASFKLQQAKKNIVGLKQVALSMIR